MSEQAAIASLIDCNRRLIRILSLAAFTHGPQSGTIGAAFQDAVDKLDAAERALLRETKAD